MQSTRRGKLNLPVARTILEDISSGKLVRGARVPEAAYSAQCRVSRTPVRQALQFLEKLGAVTIRSHLGARVQSTAAQARAALKSRNFNASSGSGNGVDPAFMDVAQRIKDFLAADGNKDGSRGAIIKDAVIARKLGVSRTTANRGLALLAGQNLLQALPRRGWKRVVVGPRELADLYDFRLAIEPPALESGWNYFDLAELEDLLVRTLAAAESKKDLPLLEAVALDQELHRAILRACANPMLRRAMEEQDGLRGIAVLPPWRDLGRREKTFREHVVILRAMLKRDKRAAVKALRAHLLSAKEAAAERTQASWDAAK